MEGLNFTDLVAQFGLGGGILFVGYKIFMRVFDRGEAAVNDITTSIDGVKTEVSAVKEVVTASHDRLNELVNK